MHAGNDDGDGGLIRLVRKIRTEDHRLWSRRKVPTVAASRRWLWPPSLPFTFNAQLIIIWTPVVCSFDCWIA